MQHTFGCMARIPERCWPCFSAAQVIDSLSCWPLKALRRMARAGWTNQRKTMSLGCWNRSEHQPLAESSASSSTDTASSMASWVITETRNGEMFNSWTSRLVMAGGCSSGMPGFDPQPYYESSRVRRGPEYSESAEVFQC